MVFIPKAGWDCQEIDRERKEERRRLKRRELHELQLAEMVKSGTTRLASDQVFLSLYIFLKIIFYKI